MFSFVHSLLRGSSAPFFTLCTLLAVCLCGSLAVAQDVTRESAPAPQLQLPSPEERLLSRLWLQDETLAMPGGGTSSFLGIGVADVTTEMAGRLRMEEPRGVVVTSVSDGSPAQKAGIRVKDVVLTYNGTTLEGRQQLIRVVGETPAGRTVRLGILREGASMEISLVTAARRMGSAYVLGEALGQAREAASRVWVVMPDIPRMLTVYHSAPLGIDSEPLTPQLAAFFGVKEGALVREVAEDSAAEKAGVKAGDVIVALAERAVTKPSDVGKILREQTTASSPLKLSLVRHQKEMTLPIVPEENGERARHRLARPATPRVPKAVAIRDHGDN